MSNFMIICERIGRSEEHPKELRGCDDAVEILEPLLPGGVPSVPLRWHLPMPCWLTSMQNPVQVGHRQETLIYPMQMDDVGLFELKQMHDISTRIR